MNILQSISLTLILAISSCQAQTNSPAPLLASKDFEQAIKATPKAIILDVRTPAEFEKEHMDHAVNINWNSPEFEANVLEIDKNQPLYVYCLSGGRSKKATTKLAELGFTNVYELQGGILKWKADGMMKPETKQIGMTQTDFQNLINSDKKVLVDFYAKWCGPCKLMEPYLLKMQNEMADKLVIVRIDVDANKTLATQMKIDQLPILMLYQNKEIVWKNIGYIKENDLKNKL